MRTAALSLWKIYQNCNVFNDGAFEVFTEKATKPVHTLFVEQGKPLTFAGGTKGICINEMKPRIIDIGPDFSPNDCWIHDERDNFKASILVRLFDDRASGGCHARGPSACST